MQLPSQSTAGGSNADADLLLLQLQKLQEDLEVALLDRLAQEEILRKAQAALAAERSQPQPRLSADEAVQRLSAAESAARDRVKTLEAELTSVRTSLAAEATRNQQSQTRANELSSRLATLETKTRDEQQAAASRIKDLDGRLAAAQRAQSETQQALAIMQRERDLLVTQLHQVQEELAHHYAQWKALADAPRVRTPGAVPVNVGRMLAAGSQTQAPHRHQHFNLHDVQCGTRRWRRLEVRLVEHGGRPGLALFRRPDQLPPVSAWHASGTEGNREFMLVIPSERTGQRLVAPLGTADWNLITGLAALIEAATLDDAGPDGLWLGAARRLARQLVALPDRLRYDRLHVVLADGRLDTLELQLSAASFGPLALGDLCLRWRPGGAVHLACMATSETGELPIGAWPVAASGALAPQWALPVGGAVPARERRSVWSDMQPVERELTLGLLDVLTAAANQAPAGTDPATLRAAAQSLQRDARRSLAAVRLHQIARRLMGRAMTPGASE